MEEDTPNDFSSQSAFQQVLFNAERFLAAQSAIPHRQNPINISSSSTGFVPIEDTIELIEQGEQLSLEDATEGDVVWWRTLSGTTGYFLVTEPYIKTVDSAKVPNFTGGNGVFRIIRDPGIGLGNQEGSGKIHGATFGGPIGVAKIVVGMSLDYVLQRGGVGSRSLSTPVTQMGIIRRQELRSGQ